MQAKNRIGTMAFHRKKEKPLFVSKHQRFMMPLKIVKNCGADILPAQYMLFPKTNHPLYQ